MGSHRPRLAGNDSPHPSQHVFAGAAAAAHDIAHPEGALQATVDSPFHKFCHCKQFKDRKFYGVNLGANGVLASAAAGQGEGGIQAVVECGAHAVAFYKFWGWGLGAGAGSSLGGEGGILGGHGVYTPAQYAGVSNVMGGSGGFGSPWGLGGGASAGGFTNNQGLLYPPGSPGVVSGWFANVSAGLSTLGPSGAITGGQQHYYLIGALHVPG